MTDVFMILPDALPMPRFAAPGELWIRSKVPHDGGLDSLRRVQVANRMGKIALPFSRREASGNANSIHLVFKRMVWRPSRVTQMPRGIAAGRRAIEWHRPSIV